MFAHLCIPYFSPLIALEMLFNIFHFLGKFTNGWVDGRKGEEKVNVSLQ